MGGAMLMTALSIFQFHTHITIPTPFHQPRKTHSEKQFPTSYHSPPSPRISEWINDSATQSQ